MIVQTSPSVRSSGRTSVIQSRSVVVEDDELHGRRVGGPHAQSAPVGRERDAQIVEVWAEQPVERALGEGVGTGHADYHNCAVSRGRYETRCRGSWDSGRER